MQMAGNEAIAGVTDQDYDLNRVLLQSMQEQKISLPANYQRKLIGSNKLYLKPCDESTQLLLKDNQAKGSDEESDMDMSNDIPSEMHEEFECFVKQDDLAPESKKKSLTKKMKRKKKA